jgi:hypothetical protein
MSFTRSGGPPLFVAPINEHNAACLDGVTEPMTEFANPATIILLDLSLWHCRLAHHNLTDVKVLIEHNLVTGMRLNVKTAPDLICEPCLAGKMRANPFASSSWRASHAMELVHSDVHEVPYRSYLDSVIGSLSLTTTRDFALCCLFMQNPMFSTLSSSLRRLQGTRRSERSRH